MENKIIFKNKKVQANNIKDKSVKQENIEDTKDVKIEEYIEQLNPLELIAYEIAKSRLKTAFDIEKSIGFIGFKS